MKYKVVAGIITKLSFHVIQYITFDTATKRDICRKNKKTEEYSEKILKYNTNLSKQ